MPDLRSFLTLGKADATAGQGRDPLGTPDAAGPDPGEVRGALQRIFASSGFEATERLRAFLAYVVEEALCGRSDRIKAYTIATDLFGRDASFDAHADPIVRIEAGRLRRALERYYLGAGRDDPIVVSIPKGRYAPVFERRASALAGEAPSRPWSWRRGALVAGIAVIAAALFVWAGLRTTSDGPRTLPLLPRVAVMPFEDHTLTEGSREIARGLTQEILDQIVRFKDVVAVEVDTQAGEPTAALARYALAGSVDVEGRRLRVRARVLDLSDGSVIWSDVYDGDLDRSAVLDLEARIGREVAGAVAQPYGAIHRAGAAEADPPAHADAEAYRCTLRYYAYRAELDAPAHPAVRDCLERTVRAFPDYSTGWALLSQTYIDEIRFHYEPAPGAQPVTIATALSAARRAVGLDPRNVRALQAEMLALSFGGETEAALAAGRKAMAINPDDAELVGEYGFRLALDGSWDEGCGLIAKARAGAPGPVGYFESALSLCAYFRGAYQEAVGWVERSTMPKNPAYHLIALFAYVEAGMMREAMRERDWVVAHAPAFASGLEKEVARRFARPQDREKILRTAAKVGLPLPSPSAAVPGG